MIFSKNSTIFLIMKVFKFYQKGYYRAKPYLNKWESLFLGLILKSKSVSIKKFWYIDINQANLLIDIMLPISQIIYYRIYNKNYFIVMKLWTLIIIFDWSLSPSALNRYSKTVIILKLSIFIKLKDLAEKKWQYLQNI